MTQFGFVIDQRACIGCHACTVACKSENDVPLGSFRTWVKYIEKGQFPDNKRYFSVNRCNHCTDAPCVNICPTKSLYKREDGIVDFDNNRCIGCKSCMQACPYDALYIEPESHTAAKCNFCAHRVEVGLEPACGVVCPTHAIISGDLDDPLSEIAKMVASQPVHVRAPEQGTGPNVFYIGADEAAINPTITMQPSEYIWAERNLMVGNLQPQLEEADMKARTVYDIDHPVHWGWKVSAYLWTKSIGAGAAIVAAGSLLRGRPATSLLATGSIITALVMVAITGVLLVADLKRPGRFLYIFLKSNFDSWLVRGSYILAAYAGVLSLWLLARILGNDSLMDALRWPVIVLGMGTASYTAWLFGQAEGRDLWQTPLLAPVLVAQALVAGAGTLAIGALITGEPKAVVTDFARMMLAGAIAWGIAATIELSGEHPTEQARLAAKNLIRKGYARGFWLGIALGIVAPIVLAAMYLGGAPTGVLALGGGAGLIGLASYEHAFIRAGQSIPLS